jgi:hypothetical protein
MSVACDQIATTIRQVWAQPSVQADANGGSTGRVVDVTDGDPLTILGEQDQRS